MVININNYERFIIDYIDGNLDKARSAELLYFLSEHPEIESGIDEWEKLTLPVQPEFENFPGKQSLKKDFSKIEKITPANIDEFIIARIEGDLDEFTLQKFELYKKFHPEVMKQELLYRKLKLMPDENIKYPGKKNLKQPIPFYISLRKTTIYISAVAAVLLFILLFNNPFKKIISPSPGTSIVQSTPESVPKNVGQRAENSKVAPEQNVTIASTEQSAANRNKKNRSVKTFPETENNDQNLNANRQKIILNKLTPKNITLPLAEKQNNDISQLGFANTKTVKKQIIPPDSTSLLAIGNKIEKKLNTLKDMNMWKAIEMSFKGINDLTESDLSLETQTNEEGKVTAFAITSNDFKFWHNSKK